MKNGKFEAAKIKRLINTHGKQYAFKRAVKNDFNEPGDTYTLIADIKGVYHEKTTHIKLEGMEAATVQKKKSPFILAHFQEAAELRQDDFLVIGETRYTVTGITDYMLWGVIADISLEVEV